MSVLIFLIAICFLLPFSGNGDFLPETGRSDFRSPVSSEHSVFRQLQGGVFVSYLFILLFNSIIVCVVTLLGLVILASMAGYAVTRSKKRIFKVTYVIFAITLIIPMQANMVFLYQLGTAFNLINTRWPF